MRPTLGVLLLALTACGASRRAGSDGVQALLDRADAAYDAGDLRAAEEALSEAAVQAPERPDVLWRRARLETAQGLASTDPIELHAHTARGRALAARCLDGDPGLRRRRQAAGWPAAVELVGPLRRPCLDQLAWAWTRWWLSSDPVAMDLDTWVVEALSTASSALEGRWAQALVVGARAGGRPALALEQLDVLDTEIGQDPVLVADRVELLVMAGRLDEARAASEGLSALPESPRRVASEARVSRILDGARRR